MTNPAGHRFGSELTSLLSGYVEARDLHKVAHGDIPLEVQLQLMQRWERELDLPQKEAAQLRHEINVVQQDLYHHGPDGGVSYHPGL
ncbi:hypothetical protein [Streptomyces sp. URMC 123]|uniref:hypothetical protein n=1 Tax=Streptomyces sp. URMC 123 TaxID=3423403 RepID=UPI003F1C4C60